MPLAKCPHGAPRHLASTMRRFSNCSASPRAKSTACARAVPLRKQRNTRRSVLSKSRKDFEVLAKRARALRSPQTEPLWRIVSTRIPTKWGVFDAIGYERDISNDPRGSETALALVMGDLTEDAPLLRIHS